LSLKGSVEDLPLLEILQVVAFCQKTGHLTVRAPEGNAGVIFREGRVVSGYIWDEPTAPPGAGPDEKRIRERIASILERLVRLREGDFAFNLTEQIPTRFGERDLSAETLSDGINPEEMMLDLARKLDEDRREGAATLEASFSVPLAPEGSVDESAGEVIPGDAIPGDAIPGEATAGQASSVEGPPAASASQEPRRSAILLVDDEADVCRVVGSQLAESGLEVSVAASLGHARREMARLAAEKRRFLLVVDLGLPSESGTSFRGGLDVVRHASELVSPPPVLLMCDSIDEKLRARAKRLGVSLMAFKPGLSKLDPLQYAADLRAFGVKLAQDLLPRLEGRRARAGSPGRPSPLDDAARAAALRSALEAIEAEPDPGLVSLQLLHAARSFFPRAILFVVKDDRLRGVSGFGPTQGPDPLDVMARDLTVVLDEPSPLADAVASGRPWSDALPQSGPMRALLEQVGPFGVRSAAVVPIRAWHATVAALYADAPNGTSLPLIDPFIAFVEQTSRALESALLARRTPQAVSC
jgi:CheY-like chemotaxis protein